MGEASQRIAVGSQKEGVTGGKDSDTAVGSQVEGVTGGKDSDTAVGSQVEGVTGFISYKATGA